MNKSSFVGIDISKNTLDIALCNNTKEYKQYQHLQVTNDVAGFTEMFNFLEKAGVKLGQTVIGMENTGRYGLELRLFLEKNCVDYCVFKTNILQCTETEFRDKTDKLDSQRLAKVTWMFRDTLTYSRLSSSIIRKLQELLGMRKLYKTMAATCKQEITESKKTPEEYKYIVAVETKEYLEERIKDIEERMLKLINSDESISRNYRLLCSISGIGMVNAISIIIHTGNFRDITTARKYASYIGVAPMKRESGTSVRKRTGVSKRNAVQLKADLTQAAMSAIQYDRQMRTYRERKEAEGKVFGVMLNAVKFKLLTRMFAVVKRGTPYVDVCQYKS